MDIKGIIVHYIDQNGLVAPAPQPTPRPIGGRGSDNGVLHTSRYLLILKQRSEVIDRGALKAVFSCINKDGILNRAPGDPMENAPDDHYGFLSLMNALGVRGPKLVLPWKCMHPMLLYLRGLYNRNPLARLFSPLMGLIIALSNRRKPSFLTEDSSDRLLTWNIIQGTRSSFFCRWGASIWYNHQTKLYGDKPINKLFDLYYPRGILHIFVMET